MKLTAEVKGRTYEVAIEDRPPGKDGYSVRLGSGNQSRHDVRVLARDQDLWTLEIDGAIVEYLILDDRNAYLVMSHGSTLPVKILTNREKATRRARLETQVGPVRVRAQMPGKVVQVLKAVGDSVDKGEGLVVLEAMKMQNEIRSPKSGVIVKSPVANGAAVSAGAILFEIE